MLLSCFQFETERSPPWFPIESLHVGPDGAATLCFPFSSKWNAVTYIRLLHFTSHEP